MSERPAEACKQQEQKQEKDKQEDEQEGKETMMGARRRVLMKFTFVRHGETKANKERCIQGHTDIPLCESGEEQASRAGERLQDVVFSRVYASDLCRASATCRRILDKNTRHPPPIIIDKRLRERNFGSVEGLGFEEVLKLAEANGSSWPSYSPPGAETLGEVQARLVAFFKGEKPSGQPGQESAEANMEEENMRNEAKEKEATQKKPDEGVDEGGDGGGDGGGEAREHVLVVSHGAALRQLYTHLHRTLGCALPGTLGPDAPLRLTPNTGISQYTVSYSPKTYTLECVRIHDNAHTQGM
ncbi:Fructose-2,6-bisphosphatase TIGAR [Chionoecetes opilio]|uniref:Fructose-2,6-bisphosphatase TIGAR n=1 Tax=Chionoecetes opilio TaxID=41210 RepID=A0A8J5D497_CHIOP|nr:Fructose-2,6-bisphosphatase TIGAR [Chionoecetes opilio]